MCGIMGYVGNREATTILMNGLKRLEYRGYDSAGVAVIENGAVQMRRSEGKLVNLEKVLADDPCSGTIGIGHTRWATHGRPSEINAHPHKADRIVVVHNGIIENYLALRERLADRGRVFSSETDTEIIAHLIDEYIKEGNDFETAVRLALKDIRGSYAIGVLDEGDQSTLIGARSASPMVVGLGEDEYFLASDIPALLEHTREMIFLEDEEIVVLDPSGYRFVDLDGGVVEHEVRRIEWTLLQAEKEGYKHFMLKEIYEQPQAVTDTFRGRIYPDEGEVYLESALTEDQYRAAKRLIIVACGTSYHAALVAKFMIEEICRIPVEVDLASEFRYRNPLVDDETLLVSISQSGETADTIAAQEEAASRGATTLTICNVVDSSIVRKADGVVYTHAGPEISVASTKAFTTQLTALYLLALRLGRLKGSLDKDRTRVLLEELISLPQVMEEVLKQDDLIRKIARKTMHFRDFLYLGRGSTYPIALEGALKLKEISYIHAEGYPAGEMKHGPIALIDENLPVVVVAPKGATYEKILGNMEEVKSRGGYLIVLANAGDDDVAAKADDLIVIPPMSAHLAPIPMVLPLQLLAYHIATLKGTDVDQPRNLAKSVTVE